MKFLNLLNDNLTKFEEKIIKEENYIQQEDYINIFILGLPRTGTTLLTQLIFYNMDILCTNNLIAKFWKTPLVGSMLSKIIIGKNKIENYSSFYGNTQYPWEPHEFSWFWHDILGITEDSLPISPEEHNIDWDKVKNKLLGINKVLESSIVHKPLELTGYWLKEFVYNFKKVIFIYIERDILDIAISLAEARLRKYNTYSKWWGSMPLKKDYLLIKNKPWNIQIAGQVYFLHRMYKNKLIYVPEERLIITSYKEICEEPLNVLEKIESKSKILGNKIKILKFPPKFKFRTKTNSKLKKNLIKGFKVIEKLVN